jgi:hypothetical protein
MIYKLNLFLLTICLLCPLQAKSWDPGVEIFEKEMKAAQCVFAGQILSEKIKGKTNEGITGEATVKVLTCLYGADCSNHQNISFTFPAYINEPDTPVWAMTFPAAKYVIISSKFMCSKKVVFDSLVVTPRDHIWDCDYYLPIGIRDKNFKMECVDSIRRKPTPEFSLNELASTLKMLHQ